MNYKFKLGELVNVRVSRKRAIVISIDPNFNVYTVRLENHNTLTLAEFELSKRK